MKPLSFAWTTPAVLAAHFQPGLTCKTRTRRDWAPRTVKSWCKCLAVAGQPGWPKRFVLDNYPTYISAWDKSARFGGKPFGVLKLTDLTLDLPTRFIADCDWESEGFDMLQAIGQEFQKGHSALHVWRYWRSCGPDENKVTVVDFKLVEVNAYGEKLWRELEEKHGDRLWQRVRLEVARASA